MNRWDAEIHDNFFFEKRSYKTSNIRKFGHDDFHDHKQEYFHLT